MVNVTKTFGEVVANDKVCLDIKQGEILSLLGENGSGKTTLMNMLAGIYFPDSGEIYINGKAVTIASPKDAFDLHIGMIHQHFKLVDVLTAAENIILGLNESAVVDLKKVRAAVKKICDRYGFVVNPDKKVYDMSVSEKQTLEIVKVLYRGADILILDEPTAVLTPQETQKLFCVMRNMKDDGKAIIIITHKLHEVMDVSDRVAVLRKGHYIGDVPTSETNAMKLTEMMVGRAVSLDIARSAPVNPKPRLVVKNLTVCDSDGVTRLSGVDFTAFSGEILGVAGISGSGQKELLEAIAGLQYCQTCSSMQFYPKEGGKPKELSGMHPIDIKRLGVALAFVPEDRLGMGLVGSMNLTDNMMLRSYSDGAGPFADRKKPRKLAETVVRDLEVVTPEPQYARAQTLRWQRAEGSGRQRDRHAAAAAHVRLRGARAGHQHLLQYLPSAQRAERAGIRRHLRWRRSGRAAGALRPDHGALLGARQRHCRCEDDHQGRSRLSDDLLKGREGEP